MLYQKIQEEYVVIVEKIRTLEDELSKLPEGKLICARSKKHYKWWNSDGHQKVYIPRKERALAEQLAKKKYLTLELEELQKEKNAMESYLRHHSLESGRGEQLFLEHAGYRELLEPYLRPQSLSLWEWEKQEYDKNLVYPEHLIHQTSKGIFVRSKSEAMIVHCLYIHRIPFRYECALWLGQGKIYPDFTIRHPDTGEVVYWEHFGMMDDSAYAKKAFSKMELYNSHGILPSIHLITTFETREYPLNYEVIENKIREHFL